ncbi:MAG: group II intron reverse transcriptase domain-containing protein [Lachnospiraceae bacterium]|nr:group II intron reverse transcriptase domain-containing protein [Lachnospiraceae bacterium]
MQSIHAFKADFSFLFYVGDEMSIIEKINDVAMWQQFLEHKQSNNNMSISEERAIVEFIEAEKYTYYYEQLENGDFPKSFPHKLVVNKEDSNKKRIVYSYEEEENIVLKFIAYNLYAFDDVFSKNTYAFRRGYGVKDAIWRLKGSVKFEEYYCYKADISNYFNSIDVDMLLDKLIFIKDRDIKLYELFERILKEERVYSDGQLINDNHGAMAGMPCSPFFANVYLMELDKYFEKIGVEYFRYSDDILIFAEDEKKLEEYISIFKEKIKLNKLKLNEDKIQLSKPYEPFEFLGFSYDRGVIDLSNNTKRKIKAKIKRKADALRRWQRSKKLSEDKAAIGFIKAMNKKFYGRDKGEDSEGDLTWSRWFFPNITSDKTLKEIDEYMQQYIRYIITGRHYKGNYKITYEQMKEWGYVSLVNEYYKSKKRGEKNGKTYCNVEI